MINQLLLPLLSIDGSRVFNDTNLEHYALYELYGFPVFVLTIMSLIFLVLYKKKIIKYTGISNLKYFLFLSYNIVSIIVPILLSYLSFITENGNNLFKHIEFYYYPDPILVIIFVYLYIKYNIKNK